MDKRDKKLLCVDFLPQLLESSVCGGDDALRSLLDQLNRCKTVYDQMNCFGILKHDSSRLLLRETYSVVKLVSPCTARFVCLVVTAPSCLCLRKSTFSLCDEPFDSMKRRDGGLQTASHPNGRNVPLDNRLPHSQRLSAFCHPEREGLGARNADELA